MYTYGLVMCLRRAHTTHLIRFDYVCSNAKCNEKKNKPNDLKQIENSTFKLYIILYSNEKEFK